MHKAIIFIENPEIGLCVLEVPLEEKNHRVSPSAVASDRRAGSWIGVQALACLHDEGRRKRPLEPHRNPMMESTEYI
jgi:hypothetical protein